MDHPDLEKPVSLQKVRPCAAIKWLKAARKSDPVLDLQPKAVRYQDTVSPTRPEFRKEECNENQ